jgi:diketogulonate reductase-like aldo/keto reductase
MAHSPIEQSRLARDPQLVEFAQAIDMTRAQVALAWPLRHNGMIAIPKISQREHLRETVSALDIELTARQLNELNRHFLAPNKPDALEMPRKFRCSRLRHLPNDKPKRIWQRKGHGDDGVVRSA